MPDAMPHTQELMQLVDELVKRCPPAITAADDFLAARFDAGLAWVNYPVGLGGLGLPQSWQSVIEGRLATAHAPEHDTRRIGIGLGMAAPTILRFGTRAQQERFLRPLWLGQEVWCQLFSEPGAGSDLAAVGTRAVLSGDTWHVTGQKVWTSSAHHAEFAILVARTDPNVPKHAGMTYFLCDMRDPGVEVRPLRQLTGEAEFNEVFLDNVAIPDTHRLGEIGEGWAVAMATLDNERVSIGGSTSPREGGMIGVLAAEWRQRPQIRTPELHDRLMQGWVAAEAGRLAAERLRQQVAVGQPGPEGAAMKLGFARLTQLLSGLEIEMLGEEGLRYDDWSMKRPNGVDFNGRGPGYRFLRAKGNSIEGGTSEILRNVVAERVLGLPPEPRTDKGTAWKDIPK
jgi:alkylation response protein AidB-like acyl-CoA dehydrogenase